MPFNPVLPDDLKDLPVNLLCKREKKQVEFVGYRYATDEGLPEEVTFEVEGDDKQAEAIFNDKVLPAIREWAQARKEQESNGSNETEAMGNNLAQAKQAEGFTSRRARHSRQ